MVELAPQGQLFPESLPAILLVERDHIETMFVETLVRRILRADVWLWHEERFDAALKVLAITSFRLILVGAPVPKLSNRQVVLRIRAVAPRTPILLRLPPAELQGDPRAPRIYAGVTVAPKQHAESVLQAVRRAISPVILPGGRSEPPGGRPR